MNTLLQSGIELMIVGMGIVFAFLATLVGIIHIMAHLIRRFAPDPEPTATQPVQTSPHSQQQTIAAITAAIHRYRAKQ